MSLAASFRALVLVALPVGLVLAAISTAALSRAVGATKYAPPSDIESPLVSLKCGFTVHRPGLLSVSYPLATLIVTEHQIVLSGPLGDHVFDRDTAQVKSLRRNLLFRRVRLASADVVATVFVRDDSALR